MKVLLLILLIIIYLLPAEVIGLKVFWITVLSLIWLIYVLFFIIYHQQSKIKKNKCQRHLFIKELPNTRTPLELGYLINGKIDSSLLGIVVMELIRKKALLLRYNPQHNDYIFVYNKDKKEEVTNAEQNLLDWFLTKVGDGEKVSLSRLKNEAYTNNVYFLSCYHEWYTLASFEGTKMNFFETEGNILDSSLAYIGLSLVLVLLGLINHTPIYIVSLVATVVLVIYVSSFHLRTTDGNSEYSKWISLSHSIKRGEACNNVTDLSTIERLIIYSKILHKSINKNLNMILNNNKHIYDKEEFILYNQSGILNEIYSKMKRLVPIATALNLVFWKNKGSKAVVKYKKNGEA